MRWCTVRLGLAIALVASSKEARAADPDLAVTRGAGAEQCPDAAQLLRAASASMQGAAAAPAHAYRVSFERAPKFRVDVVDETSHRSRRLEDTGTSCGPLAQATAVVLATMWGSEARDDAAASSARADPPPSEPREPAPSEPEPPPVVPAPTTPMRWFIGAGGGLALGIVRPATPALHVDGGFERGHASLAIGGLWIPRQRFDIAPGSIDVSLFAASARACAFLGDVTHLGLCGRFYAGALAASGRGFSVDTSATRPWLAVGAEGFVGGPIFGLLRYRAAMAALVPFHAEVFSASGAGIAYETPPYGALFTLSIEAASHQAAR